MTGFKIISRYMFSSQNRHRGRTVRIILSLAVSTVVMMVILSIMNHLQVTQIDVLRSVRSFPLTVEVEDEEDARALLEEYSSAGRLFIYREAMALLQDGSSAEGMMVRYIDASYNGGLYTTGGSPTEGIFLPYRSYGDRWRSSVTLTMLEEGSAARLAPRRYSYPVEGYYQSRLAAFDNSHLFLPLSAAPSSLPWIVAFTELSVDEAELARELESAGYAVTRWQEGESTIYSALLLEKTVMALLLSSLYVITLVQIIQSALMLSRTKKRECASLCLMGFSRARLSILFGLIGLLLAAVSSLLGLVASRILLEALPHILAAFSNTVFHLDLVWFIYTGMAVMILSFISYALAFNRVLGQKELLEALSAV